tara:strand:- start:517 stop:729 length:213 start_codon:yes stop_codon:yes gene_type:complete
MKIIMFSMAIISALNIMGCTIYDGMSMKPHKTSVTTTYGQDEVDKANDSKDQTKDSMSVTVKQEFIWEDN